MKKIAALLCVVIALASCKKDTPSGLILHGTIEGLKVGTVYLQQVKDNNLINLDSVHLNGSSSFTLHAAIDEPQLLYLYLDKKDAAVYNDRVAFFAADTTMRFQTALYNFEKEAVFTGSKNHLIYEEFLKNSQKLTAVFTDLMKRELVLEKATNPSPEAYAQLEQEYNAYLRKKVLYSMNFANNNKNTAVAAYLLAQEKEQANPKLLDSIFKMMPKKIQHSLYGKELSEFLKNSKT